MGAIVTVVEVDPIRALEAAMDGFRVANAAEAATTCDVFVTATGNLHVWGGAHYPLMRDGAILANAGHFNDEFDLDALAARSTAQREVRTVHHRIPADRWSPDPRPGRGAPRQPWRRRRSSGAGHGHELRQPGPRARVLRAHVAELEPAVYTIPDDIDRDVARLKLDAMGIAIDQWTAEQAAYVGAWRHGT